MAEVESNEGNMLLKMLVELYITIRGQSCCLISQITHFGLF